MKTGLDVLLTKHADWIRGKRIGLLAHPASVNEQGQHSAQKLHDWNEAELVALFGPEHGFWGGGGAGENLNDQLHPEWNIPVYSLYGEHRKPSDTMLKNIDMIIVDLQDLAVRCYTFVSTLRNMLECGKPVIVVDRPVPFPNTVDGPMLNPNFGSFVAHVPAPLVYGMTQGEAAQWLCATLKLDVDLRIARMENYRRETNQPMHWISPSPGIRYWETAWAYPTTVCFEALPAVDYGRGSTLPFQVITAPWIQAETLAKELNQLDLKGVIFHPYWSKNPGVRLTITDPNVYQPVTASVALLATLQNLYGIDTLWKHDGTREEFFDKLMGTDSVRRALQQNEPWQNIVQSWQNDLDVFKRERQKFLLYP